MVLSTVAVMPFINGRVVLATTQSVNGGQLKIQAVVLPAHTVIVDEQGEITLIASNTTEGVEEPKVYRGNAIRGNEQELTPAIFAEYRRFVPEGKSRIGILYDKNSIVNVLIPPKFSLPFSQKPVPPALK